MADGHGCMCAASGEGECGCGVDWTPMEVYELRARLAILGDAARAAYKVLKKSETYWPAGAFKEEREAGIGLYAALHPLPGVIDAEAKRLAAKKAYPSPNP